VRLEALRFRVCALARHHFFILSLLASLKTAMKLLSLTLLLALAATATASTDPTEALEGVLDLGEGPWSW
jgi:hypothetical protein